jgi:3-oxoacyl-[acyl-carrier protein] reductase
MPTNTLPLAGRVALVTGANHGIGAATAVALAALGADVAAAGFPYDADAPEHADPGRPAAYSRDRAAPTEGTADAVRAVGRRAIAVDADLTDPDAPRRIMDETERQLGPVGILVHNASGWRKDTFLPNPVDRFGRRTDTVTAETADTQLLVDARAGGLLIAEMATRHVARKATWGRIVTLTSGGSNGFPGEVSYGAAKAALENYTMSAAAELAPLGITANVLYPPVTDTGWVTDDIRNLVAESADLVHVAEPAEVAEVIGWLCTDAARMVTGNVIRMR